MKKKPRFKFQLYIAGDTHNSALAVANLKTLCHSLSPAQPEVEIVDVFQEPKRALADGIFMTPTLVKLNPNPVKKIVGTLTEIELVRQTLGLKIR